MRTHLVPRSVFTGPRLALVACLALALVAPSKAASPAGPASLIYAGWFGNTIPTPAFVSANLAFLESQPFDGLVVYLRDPGLTSNITQRTMTNNPVSYENALWVMSPLATLSFTHLTENLALIQGSSPPDFFDDWSVPIQNFANVARAAKDSGLKGICFDNEQYAAPWGDYGGHSKYAATKTLAQYQAQARLRGKQVMEAMVAQFPGLVFLTLHGPSVSEPDAPPAMEFPQWQSGNELLGPYFAGFMEGAGDSATCMDGGELYTLRTEAQFQAAYDWNRNVLPSDTVDCAFIPSTLRGVWPGRSSISFGIYDCPWGGAGMSPAILRTTIANALRRADRYAWFYAEASTYLLPAALGGASAAWVDAVRLGRTDAGTTPPPTDPPAPAVPATPTNLSGQAVSSSEIGLTWTDASSNENGFSIERLNGGTWSQIGWVASNVTSYAQAGLTASTGYSYRVLAFNGAGTSTASSTVTVTTPAASQIPAAPTNLSSTAVTTTSVSLAWTDGSTNENGFSIERQNGATWSQIAWVADNVTTYTNTGLTAGTAYSYRVLAFNGSGNSAVSNAITAYTTPVSQIPAAPTNLAATGVTTSSISVSWTDTSSNENGFSIERQINGTWTQVGWVADNVTAYTHTGLAAGTSYSLRVLAFNGSGNSATTNAITTTTTALLQIPGAPTNLGVVTKTSTTVTLGWTDGSSNENGFSIERKVGTTWTQIGWVPDDTLTFKCTGLSPGTTYKFRVLAFNGAGNSPVTNEVSVKTKGN
ncbi:MAG TPA: fibronectin type III domain-containing protein [Gemmatimonadales bacterium]|nr:fibronectin type III domain-containing protein [Gemmatimonadales bacterium]